MVLEKLKSLYQGWKDTRISTSKQRHPINVKSMLKFDVETTFIWGWLVDSKKQFCYYVMFLYVNVEKITVFECRSNVTLSTLNQRRNFKLRQRWFWVGSKNQFCSCIMMFEKLKSSYQRWKDYRISTSKQFSLWWSPVSLKLGPYCL